MKLNNKVALVTSSTKGIGLESAKTLARNGAIVYFGARRLDAAQKICDELKLEGFIGKPVYFDASKPETYETMVKEVINDAGRLDILVNNYGGGQPEADFDVVNGSTKAFFEIIEDNLRSVYLTAKYAIPSMIENGGGSIINISSIGGSVPDISRTGYGVSKAAVNNLTEQIAMQYARYNIRCNAVLPGLIATDAALNNMPQEFLNSFLRHVPLKRIGQPKDIASAVLFFASDDSSFITGEIMEVAGGYALGTPQYADFVK